MAIQAISIGTLPNDGTGDSIRVAFNKANQNFTYLQSSITDLVANSVVVTDVARLEGGGLFTGSFKIRATDLDTYYDVATTNQTFAGGTVAGATQFTSTQEATAIGSGGAVQVTGGFGVAGRAYFSQIFSSNITLSAGLNYTSANTITASLANLEIGNVETGLVFATDGIRTFGNVNAANLVLGTDGQITFGDGTSLASALQTLTSNAAVQAAELDSLVSNAVTQSVSITSLQANIAAANAVIAGLGALDVGAISTELSALGANITAANIEISSLWSNAATQSTEIDDLRANVTAANSAISGVDFVVSLHTSAIASINSNVTAANVEISSLWSNAASQSGSLTIIGSTVSDHTTDISNLDAGLSAANASIVTVNANVSAANSSIANKTFASLADVNIAGVLNGQTVIWDTATSKLIPADLSGLSVGNASELDGHDSTYFATNAAIIAANVEIDNLRANITAANVEISNLSSNATTQGTEINDLRANVTAANVRISAVTDGLTASNVILTALDANVGSIVLTTIPGLVSNAATQSTEIDNLRANVTAANVEIDSLRSNITAANTHISTIDANIGAYHTYANLSFAPINYPQFTGHTLSTEGNVVAFGGNAIVYVASAPTTSKGANGDIKGMVFATGTDMYICYADYTGSADIWARVSGLTATWP